MKSSSPPSPIRPEDERMIIAAMTEELTIRPPTIGLIGVSGVGKSSTINAMFKTSLPISHVSACTKEFLDTDLGVTIRHGQAAGHGTRLRVIDAPGLGEDISLDHKYLTMYRKELGRCDVILWVLAARNRAVALEQQYLQQLLEFAPRVVFGVNQVDLVDPINWDQKLNLPSLDQERNVSLIVADRRERLASVVGMPIKMVAYSASHKWNLQELFTTLVESCPERRAWIFSDLKAFRPEDFLPEDVRDAIWRQTQGHQAASVPVHGEQKARRWFRR